MAVHGGFDAGRWPHAFACDRLNPVHFFVFQLPQFSANRPRTVLVVNLDTNEIDTTTFPVSTDYPETLGAVVNPERCEIYAAPFAERGLIGVRTSIQNNSAAHPPRIVIRSSEWHGIHSLDQLSIGDTFSCLTCALVQDFNQRKLKLAKSRAR